jgi:hypothetical protein
MTAICFTEIQWRVHPIFGIAVNLQDRSCPVKFAQPEWASTVYLIFSSSSRILANHNEGKLSEITPLLFPEDSTMT